MYLCFKYFTYLLVNFQMLKDNSGCMSLIGTLSSTAQHSMACEHQIPTLLYRRVHPQAVAPKKAHASDAGYDITIVAIDKKVNATTTLYDTGIQIQLDRGYYAELVPRSSIIKTGHVLANSIGIIDNDYTGNIKVALAKIDPDAPDIELPYRGFQLIVRKQVECGLAEEVDAFQTTERGEGGFGSTGQ
jgi:deoxyuridine 5'-triphosphate nucleotidohydrolase